MYNLKSLASAVIVQAARDIRSPIPKIRERAIRDVMRGGLDLYFGLLNIEITRKEFVTYILNISEEQAKGKGKFKAQLRRILRGSKI